MEEEEITPTTLKKSRKMEDSQLFKLQTPTSSLDSTQANLHHQRRSEEDLFKRHWTTLHQTCLNDRFPFYSSYSHEKSRRGIAILCVKIGNQWILGSSVIKSHDKGIIEDYRVVLGQVNDGMRVVAIPVTEAGNHRSRVKFSLREELEESIIHSNWTDPGVSLFEVGQDNGRDCVEVDLRMNIFEEITDIAVDIQLISSWSQIFSCTKEEEFDFVVRCWNEIDWRFYIFGSEHGDRDLFVVVEQIKLIVGS